MPEVQNVETLFRAVEETLHTLFKEQRYEVPYYQRPYAWEKENAEELFTDLYSAFQDVRTEDSYFLGSIVLFDGGKAGRHKIIDGQQRIVTLQLLLLALADEMQDESNKEELLSYVRSKENVFAGTKSESVVKVSDRYQKFFEKLIYDPKSIIDEKGLSEPEALMLGNYRYFREALGRAQSLDALKFAVFIMQRCVVASLRAHQEHSALRIFTVLNDRGVDLHPVDILKAQLISNARVSSQDMERYAREWEGNEFSLGRGEFLNLFNYIRMLYVKSRSRKLLHEEILDELSTRQKVIDFLEDGLSRYCELYAELLNPSEPDVRNIIKVLEATGQRDWVAPALFLMQHRIKLDQVFVQLLKKVAALSIFMLCTPFTEGQRVGRYGRVLVQLEELVQGKRSLDALVNLSPSDEELVRVDQNLLNSAYDLRNIKAFLLWSETLVGDGARSIESGKMTVEHLLPQSSGNEEYWVSRFGDEWQRYANNIGNLVLVSGRMNAKLARKAFPDKKDIIKKRTRTGWVVTDQVLEASDWTPAAIRDRAADLLKRAKGAMKAQITRPK